MKRPFYRTKRVTAILCTLLLTAFHPVADAAYSSPFSITAEAKDNDTGSISLNTSNTGIVIDDSFTLRVYNTSAEQTIVCKSSDSKVVSVKASEKSASAFILKGKKCGTAEVTIRIKEGISTIDTLKCDVTVGLPATSVSFTRPKVKLAIGERTSLKTILKPNDAVEEPTYVSSDTDIAYVSGKGTVITKAVGECTITAYIQKKDDKDEYICDTCKITVTENCTETEETTEQESQVQQTS